MEEKMRVAAVEEFNVSLRIIRREIDILSNNLSQILKPAEPVEPVEKVVPEVVEG